MEAATSQAMASRVALAVGSLSVEYHTRHGVVEAVGDASFDVAEGEALAIVGESGSGKTATALAIAGLLPPNGRISGGSIQFFGREIVKCSTRERRRMRGRDIGVVFQNPMTSFNPVLTIGTQLREPIRQHLRLNRADARLRVLTGLDSVGVTEPSRRLGQYPHQLSGGMNQRALIAMAISCNPRLLIADEPTTALDVTIQAQVIDLMRELKARRKMTMVWITHDMGVVAGIADRVAVMYAGRIVEQGSVYDVYERPAHPYTAALLGAVPRLDRPRSKRLGSPEPEIAQVDRKAGGCIFASRCRLTRSECLGEQPPLVTAGSESHLSACLRWSDVTFESQVG